MYRNFSRMVRRLSLFSTCILFGSFASSQEANWDQWRGPNFNGSVSQGKPPVVWSSDTHIKWRVEVPGVGSSSPIVHGDQVIVSSAIKTDKVTDKPAEEAPETQLSAPVDSVRRSGRRASSPPKNVYKFVLISFDRLTGKQQWMTELTEEVPHEAGHSTNTFASSSPVTDGQRIYINFGSRGVFCVDMHGKRIWDNHYGKMRTAAGFGEGASPAVAADKVIVPWDHEDGSFIVALNATDGREIWRVPRDEQTTWATPLVVQHKGQTQIVTAGRVIRSYDENGKLLWQCGGQTSNPIATPIQFKDHVICMTGHRGYSIQSISLDSRGDVTGKAAWTRNDSAPYVPTPTLYEGIVYLSKGNYGVISCIDAATGKDFLESTRLEEIPIMYSSPVAASGHVYFTARDGRTVVIEAGKSGKIVSTNSVDQTVDSSLAIVGNSVFIRGQTHLFCIE